MITLSIVSWSPKQKCSYQIYLCLEPFCFFSFFFAVCHRHSAKPVKYSAKALPSVTLGKQHTTSTVSANSYLPSVFYRALGKWFAECQIWHSAKKSGLPSVFPKYTRQRIIVCRVFLELHSANLFSKEKKYFFSAYCYCLPSVFWNYTRQTYFPKKKKYLQVLIGILAALIL